MSGSPVPTPHELALDLIGRCPDCEGTDFVVSAQSDQTVFQCIRCTSRWRYNLGYLQRVSD